MRQIQEQPPWRARADREADYYDGNQLDAEVLRRQRELGIPPAIEPMIQPTINTILGLEVKQRPDFKVVPDDDEQDDLVAEALNHKLNRAERHAKADAACSEAFKSQISVGVGWVEVAREADPFKFGYRCRSVHRNEIFWDFLSKEPDLSDARYLVRRKWVDTDLAALMFPRHKELLESVGRGWQGMDWDVTLDGGDTPALYSAWQHERGWSIEEQDWRDVDRRRVCLYECWYRTWHQVDVLKSPDGRVVEFDEADPEHVEALIAGGTLERATVSKVRLSWWCGPHLLSDEPSPYQHRHFPYVPFWGYREDRTGVPYGLVKSMMFLQDEINARISKMQWLLSARSTIRTDGAVIQDDEEFRQMVARPDADFILDQAHMAQPGAKFEIQRNFELSQQQFNRLQDAREGIKRVTGVTSNFEGSAQGSNQSGLAVNSLIEQSVQAVTDMMDNFASARMQVGDILLSLIVQDSQAEERVIVPGTVVREDKEITLNMPEYDANGNGRLTNDVQRARLKVGLEDVPSTPSFRAQQLAAMSEAFKSMPVRYQEAVMPFLFSLMDVPNKAEVMEVIKQLSHLPTEEEIEQRIKDAVAQAGMEVKQREVAVKEQLAQQREALNEATIKKIVAESVNRTIQSIYSATQAGMQIAAAPQVAPIADQLLKSSGFEDADTPPIVAGPGSPMAPDAGAAQTEGTRSGLPGEAVPKEEPPLDEYEPQQNTSPAFPPVANPAEIAPPEIAAPPMGEADAGMGAGIERPGVEPPPEGMGNY
jgi:hypothetical protein